MEALLERYGYGFVVLGTFLEGETILVLAAFAAHRGYLELPWVIAAALAGSLAGDQLYFFLARRHGRDFLAKRPGWHAKAERVDRLLARSPTLFVLSFRFLYGLRTVASFVVGLGQLPAGRFFALNAVGAAIWALAFGIAGYLLGEVLERALERLERYEHVVFAAILVVGLVAWLIHALRERARRRAHERGPASPRPPGRPG